MKRNLAYVRQLCCIGLGGEAIMPTLFEAIHDIIPSASKTFLWTDRDCHVTHMLQAPGTPELTAVYIEEFYNKRELEAWPGAERLMRCAADLDWTLRGVDKSRFYRSDFYHACWEPRDSHDPIHARIYANGVGVGTLLLSRSHRDRPFLQKDLDLLQRLVPYISHAMARRPDCESSLVQCGEEGLIVLDQSGSVLYLTERAKELLSCISHPQRDAESPSGRLGFSVPAGVTQLVKQLIEVFDGADISPPMYTLENPRGRFTCRAEWLAPPPFGVDAADAVPERPTGALISIMIRHEEPVLLRLIKKLRALPLSNREKEVCLLLSKGMTHSEIATALGVRPSSVVTYVRSIYEKLDVHSRGELVGKLTTQR